MHDDDDGDDYDDEDDDWVSKRMMIGRQKWTAPRIPDRKINVTHGG